jgi:hypothetical protein
VQAAASGSAYEVSLRGRWDPYEKGHPSGEEAQVYGNGYYRDEGPSCLPTYLFVELAARGAPHRGGNWGPHSACGNWGGAASVALERDEGISKNEGL